MPDPVPSADPWHGPRRLDTAEQMDAPGVDVDRLGKALRFIRRVNGALGYTRGTVNCFAEVDWPKHRPLRVLDVATGSADVPVALLRWAKKRGRSVDVVGLDLHAETLAFAADFAGAAVPLVRGDALALPFDDGAFDVVMTSMFLHHLPDAMVVRVLAEMRRVAGRCVIAADLIRARRAYAWISLFTLLSDPMIRHDARVSVRQAFTLTEMRTLAADAGLPTARVTRRFGHRMVVVADVTADLPGVKVSLPGVR